MGGGTGFTPILSTQCATDSENRARNVFNERWTMKRKSNMRNPKSHVYIDLNKKKCYFFILTK